MGFFRRQLAGFKDADYFFKIKCKVMRLPMEGPGYPAAGFAGVDRSTTRKTGMETAAVPSGRVAEDGSRIGAKRSLVDRHWTEPVHATTHSGIAVTVSFGMGLRDGQILLCGGHVSAVDFYAMERDGMIEPHHYRVDGLPAVPKGDRDRFAG